MQETIAPTIIWEIGMNHLGDPARAHRLVDTIVAQGGTHATIQVITDPPSYIRDAQRAANLQRFCLRIDQCHDIIRHGVERGLRMGVVPVTLHHIPGLLAAGATFFKTLSTDITFEPLLVALAKTGCPVYVSTGAATVTEIVRAVYGMRTVAAPVDVRLIHTVLSVPTPPHAVNLQNIPMLRQACQIPVAYGQHSDDLTALDVAVAIGADALFVYVAEERVDDLPDGPHAVLCSDVHAVLERVRHTATLLGNPKRVLTPHEERLRHTHRRSIVAARTIAADTTMSDGDIAYMQPATGYSPWDRPRIIGRMSRACISPREDIPAVEGAPRAQSD